MSNQSLNQIARAIVANHRGILAADESTSTIAKRFVGIGVENTEENRRAYRELLFTTEGASKHIGGVILFEETLGQTTKAGKRFAALLAEQGTIPGIKVDKGTKALTFAPGEVVTEGLDGLRERLASYGALGAQFAKWRAVIDIASGVPTEHCIGVNAHALARYAALCQEAGIVPIVEPEVLMDGEHDLDRCYEVTRRTLMRVFAELDQQRVALDGILLKPNMVIPGKKCPDQASVEAVADATVRVFKETVPAAVPGIVFLSGGQSEIDATAHLSAMNARHKNLPWTLSFSYGRALQQSALTAWSGKDSNVAAAQRAYLHRCQMNGAACAGTYASAMER
ncbi:MAG: fructose-bisphosphate aldolase class I [Myxococcales bacterium]|nr:fructose-bisphosphate aldolase class I [Myxococcales bacterium]